MLLLGFTVTVESYLKEHLMILLSLHYATLLSLALKDYSKLRGSFQMSFYVPEGAKNNALCNF